MSNYDEFIAEVVRADKEIGFVEVKSQRGKPLSHKQIERWSSKEVEPPKSVIWKLIRSCDNAQKIYYGNSSHAYRYYFPKAILTEKALNILADIKGNKAA